MSDEQVEPITHPPVVDVPRPDIAAPAPKKRGRKPMPRDAAGNIIRDPAQVEAAKVSTELRKRLPPGAEMLTDANVGKALAGAFAAIGIFRGPHWRLFASEEAELGQCFGPLARLYGPEELGKWITVLMTVPVVTGILMPRIGVEQMILSTTIEKKDGRNTLLQIKALTEAEKVLNVEQQVKEQQVLAAKAHLARQVQVGASVAADLKAEEMKADGMLTQ